jgi:hypothetical protein
MTGIGDFNNQNMDISKQFKTKFGDPKSFSSLTSDLGVYLTSGYFSTNSRKCWKDVLSEFQKYPYY